MHYMFPVSRGIAPNTYVLSFPFVLFTVLLAAGFKGNFYHSLYCSVSLSRSDMSIPEGII